MTLSRTQQVEMFDHTIEQMDAEWADKRCPDAFYITCILSDIQEAMSRGNTEHARRWLNKAKYFLSEKMFTEPPR